MKTGAWMEQRFETELPASSLTYFVVEKQVYTDWTVSASVDGHKHFCYFIRSENLSQIVCISKEVRKKKEGKKANQRRPGLWVSVISCFSYNEILSCSVCSSYCGFFLLKGDGTCVTLGCYN